VALDPFSYAVISIAGWMNQHQQHVIEYQQQLHLLGAGTAGLIPTAPQSLRYRAELCPVDDSRRGRIISG